MTPPVCESVRAGTRTGTQAHTTRTWGLRTWGRARARQVRVCALVADFLFPTGTVLV